MNTIRYQKIKNKILFFESFKQVTPTRNKMWADFQILLFKWELTFKGSSGYRHRSGNRGLRTSYMGAFGCKFYEFLQTTLLIVLDS